MTLSESVAVIFAPNPLPPRQLERECRGCGGQGVVNISHPNDPHTCHETCRTCDGCTVEELNCDHCGKPATVLADDGTKDGLPLCASCNGLCEAAERADLTPMERASVEQFEESHADGRLARGRRREGADVTPAEYLTIALAAVSAGHSTASPQPTARFNGPASAGQTSNQTEGTNMTKIVEFQAENTRILKAVRIVPDGNVVIIGGKNESGKTTVLDDIELIFAGGKSKKMPKVPIRGGQASGRTSVKLDNGMVLEREWSATGTRLIVKGADGKKMPGGAQEIADKFFSLVAFDPLEFSDKMDDKKQAEVLRQLVGLDFSALDAKRAALYSDREEQGRDLAKRKGQLATMPAKADVPDSEVSVAALVTEKDAAESMNRTNAQIRQEAGKAFDLAARAKNTLSDLRLQLEGAELAHSKAVDALLIANRKKDELVDVDTSPIVEKIQSADGINRAVRAQRERAKVAAEVDAMEAERRSLTEKIEAIDAQKAKALEAVKWPVDGLGFNSDGVTYKGFPFSQASKAARFRVSIAIGSSLNPELPCMLLRDASTLDDEAMALLATLAAEKDQMLWIERVGKNDVGAIILEDGEVVGRVVEPGKVE